MGVLESIMGILLNKKRGTFKKYGRKKGGNMISEILQPGTTIKLGELMRLVQRDAVDTRPKEKKLNE